MKGLPNQYRDKSHPANAWASANGRYNDCGFFTIPHYKVAGYVIRVQFTGGMGWEHASVTVAPNGKNATRCPTWDEMCFVKSLFWDEHEVVVQYHPAKRDYVSFHNYCLHLWRPTDLELPTPNPLMVGPLAYKPL